MVVELGAEILSSFLLFDAIGFSLLLTLPLVMSALEERIQTQLKNKINAGENPSLESLLDWRFIFCYSLCRPHMALFGFLYILSAVFIMAYFLFGSPNSVLGAYIAFFTTIGVLVSLIAVPYFYFALKTGVKILKREI